MQKKAWMIRSVALFTFLTAGMLLAQTQTARPAQKPAATAAHAPTEEELSATRDQLFKLLRLSPKLTMVVARDPSLLANQEYVTRNNPELARFLENNPEVARNPEFYLFANAGQYSRNQPRELGLQREVWPELAGANGSPILADLMRDLVPFLVFVCILGALLWLLRVILENRRWAKVFKLQTEVHSRLLDKFATNNELLTYMGTEAGKRFLEAAPIPVSFGDAPQMRGAISRVLVPLQLGAVLALVGTTFLFLRGQIPDAAIPFFVIGSLGVALGLGFIISAGLSWALARHMGLLPQNPAGQDNGKKGLTARGQL